MDRLRSLSRALTPGALTILRVVVGFVLLVHGWMKLTSFEAWRGMVADLGVPAPDVFAAFSTAAELGGGIGLMLGLLTPIAALAVLVNMIVAILLVHADAGLLAAEGGFEYPLVLALVALFFLVRGAGPASVDALIFRRRPERERGAVRPFREEAPA
ncbi:MAG: DoxX family protein [Sandaracinaceae bacterium]|nr:DoxX family protein [Sandaracinaceae bacterium]